MQHFQTTGIKPGKFGLSAFLISILAAAFVTTAAAQPTLGPSSPVQQQELRKESPILSELLEQARQDGTVRIILGVQVDTQLEGSLNRDARTSQRAAIRSAQASVLSRVPQARVNRQYQTIPFLALDVTAAELEQLMALPDVTSIMPDGIGDTSLNRSTRIVKARKIWEQGFTGSDWAVAVLDTGIFYDHRTFDRSRIVASACFSSNRVGVLSMCPGGATSSTARNSAAECAMSIEGCGHGTHVAATVAGAQNARFSGVAPGANLIPIKMFSRFSGSGCQGGGFCARYFNSDLIAALDHVLTLSDTHKIAAVNMSLQGGRFSASCGTFLPAFTQIAENLTSRGVLLVAAAGNSGWTGEYAHPACDPWVVSIGATNDNDVVAPFSNLAAVDAWLMAPGVDIEAAQPPERGDRADLSGTSMAAPHVAGAAALLRSARPRADAFQIFAALFCSGRPVARPGLNVNFPRIEITRALRALRQGTTC